MLQNDWETHITKACPHCYINLVKPKFISRLSELSGASRYEISYNSQIGVLDDVFQPDVRLLLILPRHLLANRFRLNIFFLNILLYSRIILYEDQWTKIEFLPYFTTTLIMHRNFKTPGFVK